MAAPAPRALLVALAVAGLTGAAALAGCGADTEGDAKAQADARKVVERFGTATAQRDYQTICDELLADSLVQKLENVGLHCEVAVR